ncbi:hypothetical protein U0070_017409 [Myodes glareolus]|uniref:G-protein coupled receptors family 1 profile domain-containing protein n=1 Tax=Myodes glareolus TaxID=447135 RepID=A0AAW0H3Z9_MYOGA
MGGDNQTTVTEFLLLGLTEESEQEDAVFGMFFGMYMVTISGNLLIILAISCDPHLHTPMYFFLANLSSVDICFSSVTVPKALANHMVGSKSISYMECMAQIYFLFAFGTLDNFLLSVMAYDRYVAICHPLHYTLMMRPRLCVLLVAISWVIANLHAILHTLLMVRLTFSSHNAVPHFFCDPYLVMKLSCSDTFINDVTAFAEAGLIYAIPFVCIVVSYAYICSKVLKMPSAQGIRKAMSTCGSHLTVVCLFYGAILGIYMHPSSSYSLRDAVASVIFTVVTPMTNPFIYSLRNRDIKGALRKIILRQDINDGIHVPMTDMGGNSKTMVTVFFLQGLSGKSEQEEIFFGMFLGMYLVTISGSLLIILAISCDPHLHTPMYFFLANLSNNFLLRVMAYDRYVAICHPLHYTLMMRPRLCVLLVAISWVITNLHALLHILLMARLTFCSHNAVHHFFCDPYPILKLFCSEPFINDLMDFTDMMTTVVFTVVTPLVNLQSLE